MVAIRRILCPTDVSEISRRALDHAIALARWYGAEIDALYVVQQLLPHPGRMPDYPAWTALNPAVRDEIQEEVRRFLEPARTAGIAGEALLREGDAVDEIVKAANDLGADLVVMGTHGRGGFERWVLGSVTEKVLRKAPCPVLTVSGAEHAPLADAAFKRILCAMDFSEVSRSALGYALSLAEEADAELVLLHALEWPVESDAEPRSPTFDVPEYRRYLEDEARGRLRRLVSEEARQRCRVEEIVAPGRAHAAILDAARECEIQLIVMGVHGRSLVDHVLFGSTTHQVVRAAPCPVLTIRAVTRRAATVSPVAEESAVGAPGAKR